ncbi:hypothetical protein LCGC14_1624840, partial [marine sediment metagenome]
CDQDNKGNGQVIIYTIKNSMAF